MKILSKFIGENGEKFKSKLLKTLYAFSNNSQHLLNTENQRRQWHPTPVLLPGKSHGWRSLVGCSPSGHEESDMTERLHFHFSLSCIGEGNGNPFQCSCLEDPRDGGAWWAAVYAVAQSRTRLKRLSSSKVLFQGLYQICHFILFSEQIYIIHFIHKLSKGQGCYLPKTRFLRKSRVRTCQMGSMVSVM